ncbi:MAG: hypothetical protein J7642_13980 [Cyanobacteria bacterium SBC]|nr:hypothetical protein [Cyanobacteria bacterium SBC]
MVDAGFGGIEPHSANGETPGISTLRLRLQRGTYVLALLEVKVVLRTVSQGTGKSD